MCPYFSVARTLGWWGVWGGDVGGAAPAEGRKGAGGAGSSGACGGGSRVWRAAQRENRARGARAGGGRRRAAPRSVSAAPKPQATPLTPRSRPPGSSPARRADLRLPAPPGAAWGRAGEAALQALQAAATALPPRVLVVRSPEPWWCRAAAVCGLPAGCGFDCAVGTAWGGARGPFHCRDHAVCLDQAIRRCHAAPDSLRRCYQATAPRPCLGCAAAALCCTSQKHLNAWRRAAGWRAACSPPPSPPRWRRACERTVSTSGTRWLGSTAPWPPQPPACSGRVPAAATPLLLRCSWLPPAGRCPCRCFFTARRLAPPLTPLAPCPGPLLPQQVVRLDDGTVVQVRGGVPGRTLRRLSPRAPPPAAVIPGSAHAPSPGLLCCPHCLAQVEEFLGPPRTQALPYLFTDTRVDVHCPGHTVRPGSLPAWLLLSCLAARVQAGCRPAAEPERRRSQRLNDQLCAAR